MLTTVGMGLELNWIVWICLVVLGAVSGWLLGWMWRGRGEAALRAERDRLDRELAEERTRREVEGKAAAERAEELRQLRERFEQTFEAVSSRALEKNNERFLGLAKEVFGNLREGAAGDLEQRRQAIEELVKPLRQSLEKVDGKIQELETSRRGAYAGLKEQIGGLLESTRRLQGETSSLVYALKTPSVRGRWGEIQLERTVEFAGMTERVDFVQQASGEGESGRQRPDLLVHLPGGKEIVVDAKAPLGAYLDALEAGDETQRVALVKRHAEQVRAHIKQLGSKRYWRQFSNAPEFVVLFLPGEVFFSAALEQDPELIEFGTENHVLVATPTTLIALLKATAYGWRQEAIAEQAQEISALGRQLYERLATQTGYYNDVGKALGKAVEAYNKSLRSLESRVLVTARKFEPVAGDTQKSLQSPDPVEGRPLE